MCGITGKIYFDKNKRVEKKTLSKMNGTLKHRGPDDEGYYLNKNIGLAMRRLSIIDVKGGKQPIHNEKKDIWAILNGEIYNFPQLKKNLQNKGHKFYTKTDTEVIVHLYEEYGEEFSKYLEGMFAIALWDNTKKSLYLVRDRLGIKPLYYSTSEDKLLFASEIKAIKEDLSKTSVSFEALNYYFSLLYIPAPVSIYEEIKKLYPGHILKYRNGNINIKKYWDLSRVQPFSKETSYAELKSKFDSLLEKSVKSQLISDVPLGFFLSGGLDSSAVVAYASRFNDQLKTFSVGFEEPSYDETYYANLVSKKFNTDHTKIIVKPDTEKLVFKLVQSFDEPFADSSAIPMFYLCELARKHVKVALSGDGGDELFSGYITYKADKLAKLYNRLPSVLSRNLIPGMVNLMPVSSSKINFRLKAKHFVESALYSPEYRHYAWKDFFAKDIKKSLLSSKIISELDGNLDGFDVYKKYYQEAEHFDELNKYQYADTKVYLINNNLVKVDRTSMANSLEVRVPLLDSKLVEFAFKLPSNTKMPGLRLKHFFKESMKGVLPKEVIDRPKGGFNVPMPNWIREDLKPLVNKYLSKNMVEKQGYFNAETVNFLINEHFNSKEDYSRNIWALLIFNIWVEENGMEI